MSRRRLITIPGYAIAWSVWLVASPLWVSVASLVDLFRGSRGVALRSATLVAVYLSCEVLGIVASGGLWVWKVLYPLEPQRWVELHFRLEAWWGNALFRVTARLFRLRLAVEGDGDLARGPYLLLLRHSSTADTLLASALVSWPYGIRLRYVLKRELLWDPCLDIVGQRIPNVFVDRFTDDTALEVRRVQELGRSLGPRDGVLIYPEGTRFSASKRRRLLEGFEKKGDATLLEYARSLSRVLPPRIAGTLALLEVAPQADVVVCAHTGFEGAASLAQIWRGELLDRVIRVHFRRIHREEIPTEHAARIAWLREEWRRVDAWVERHLSETASCHASTS